METDWDAQGEYFAEQAQKKSDTSFLEKAFECFAKSTTTYGASRARDVGKQLKKNIQPFAQKLLEAYVESESEFCEEINDVARDARNHIIPWELYDHRVGKNYRIYVSKNLHWKPFAEYAFPKMLDKLSHVRVFDGESYENALEYAGFALQLSEGIFTFDKLREKYCERNITVYETELKVFRNFDDIVERIYPNYLEAYAELGNKEEYKKATEKFAQYEASKAQARATQIWQKTEHTVFKDQLQAQWPSSQEFQKMLQKLKK